MIRAKTLLASVAAIGVAITTFALNSSHDGFVPETALTQGPAAKSNMALVPRRTTYSDAISKLPKLEPQSSQKETRDTTATHISPTALEVTDTIGTNEGSDESNISVNQVAKAATLIKVSGSQQIPPTDTFEAVSKQQDAKSKRPSTPQTTGIPLPTELPEEYRILRRDQWQRAAYGRPVQTDDLLNDPAVPKVRPRKTQRSIRRRKRVRKVVAKQRPSAKPKQIVQKSKAATKPVRHRQPFNHNGN